MQFMYSIISTFISLTVTAQIVGRRFDKGLGLALRSATKIAGLPYNV